MAKDDEAPGTALALPDAVAVERALLHGEALPDIIEDPEEVRRAIMLRILEGETADEILNQGGLTGWQEYLDVPVTVTGVRFNRSGFEPDEGGLPLYAVADLVLPTGEMVSVSCGGGNVMAQLLAFYKHGLFPQDVKLVKGSETGAGFKPLWLVRP